MSRNKPYVAVAHAKSNPITGLEGFGFTLKSADEAVARSEKPIDSRDVSMVDAAF